jgi:hypothetical protein
MTFKREKNETKKVFAIPAERTKTPSGYHHPTVLSLLYGACNPHAALGQVSTRFTISRKLVISDFTISKQFLACHWKTERFLMHFLKWTGNPSRNEHSPGKMRPCNFHFQHTFF